jgi:hypothetical protein
VPKFESTKSRIQSIAEESAFTIPRRQKSQDDGSDTRHHAVCNEESKPAELGEYASNLYGVATWGLTRSSVSRLHQKTKPSRRRRLQLSRLHRRQRWQTLLGTTSEIHRSQDQRDLVQQFCRRQLRLRIISDRQGSSSRNVMHNLDSSPPHSPMQLWTRLQRISRSRKTTLVEPLNQRVLNVRTMR